MPIGAFIVDDQEDVRLLVRMIIEAADKGLFVSGEAASGREAMERLEETDPAVVVVDEMMPGLSGIETAVLILRRRPGQRIILCSAYLDEELIERANAAGIHVCLAKEQAAKLPGTIRALVGERAP
jgi:two-component system vancomycin resistance associated response regulator VraR